MLHRKPLCAVNYSRNLASSSRAACCIPILETFFGLTAPSSPLCYCCNHCECPPQVLATQELLVTGCDGNEVKVWRRPAPRGTFMDPPAIDSERGRDQEEEDADGGDKDLNMSISSIAMYFDTPV